MSDTSLKPGWLKKDIRAAEARLAKLDGKAMTPKHIEEIARAILKMDGTRSDRDIDNMKDAGSYVYAYTVREATLAFNMSAEICAKEAEEWSTAKHMAFDMKAKKFPEKTPTHRAIADAIRALASESEG